MDKWAALIIGSGGILAAADHIWDTRHPEYYERTHVVRASTLLASEVERRQAWLEKNEALEKLAKAEIEIHRLKEINATLTAKLLERERHDYKLA